jgi:RNA polymerase sigma-70 factor (ECF subfamily)
VPSRTVRHPLTCHVLLNRLKVAEDADAWREFVHLYGPVVYGFARNRGLQDADAADLMQEVLQSVVRNIQRMVYDPRRGTFRGWLFTVTRNKIYNFFTSQHCKSHARATGDAATQERLDAVPDRTLEQDEDWEREYQRRLTTRAMNRVKREFGANTWEAFWRTAVEGRPVQEVGPELGMTLGAVYIAKSRILARLRKEVQSLQAGAEG